MSSDDEDRLMYRCPCCERTADEYRDIRFHLLAEHRKSELADAIMERIEEVPMPG